MQLIGFILGWLLGSRWKSRSLRATCFLLLVIVVLVPLLALLGVIIYARVTHLWEPPA